MINEMEALWLLLLPVLEEFSERFSRSETKLFKEIGCSANETCLIRAYLAFKKQKDGSEVAVIIDIKSDGHLFRIEADICHDDGRLIAPSQVSEILLKSATVNSEDWKGKWVNDFKRWLLKQEAVLVSAVSELS